MPLYKSCVIKFFQMLYTLQGDSLMVAGIEWLFKKTSVKTGKGIKSKKCILFYDDIIEKEEESVLKTKEEEEPILVVFRRKKEFNSSYLIGDVNVICTQAKTMSDSLIFLAGIYKVCEIELPKSYAQFIGILYNMIFGLHWTSKENKQSSGYLHTKKQIESEIERGTFSKGIEMEK